MAWSDPLSDPRATIARRDLASLSREKTIVLALLIQLFVAAFSSFLVVGLTSLYDPGSVAGEDVEVAITGEASESLERAAASTEGVDATGYSNNTSAETAFRDGRVDAVLVAERLPSSRISVTATAPDSSLRTTLIVVQLRKSLEAYERQQRIDRSEYLTADLVPLPPAAPASPYFSFTYTILVPLLLLLPSFISGSVAVDAITEEMERGTLELLRVAPVTLTDVVDGKAAAMAALAPAQASLWILLLELNGIAVSNVLPLLVVVASTAAIVVSVGIGFGLTLGERRSAQLLYSVGVLALFGAGVFLPEHPTTTIAKLAVDSPTTTTYALTGAYAVVAVGFYVAVRRYVRTLSPGDR